MFSSFGISASSHLTQDKIHYLENYDYVVGPKADGERMLLFWNGNRNKHPYLISPAHVMNSRGYFVSLLKTFEYF